MRRAEKVNGLLAGYCIEEVQERNTLPHGSWLMELKRELTEFIRDAGKRADTDGFFREALVGFSSADDPLYDELRVLVGPHHAHPKDILPEAVTVVSFFLPHARHVVASNRKGTETSLEWARAYIAGNGTINAASDAAIEFLRERGIAATAVPATHTFDQKTLQAGWSHRSAACIAGLGRFGVNRMLITRKGSAGRYGTIFLSEPLPADPPFTEEPCPYVKNSACGICFRSCPVRALTEQGFDRHACYARLLENVKRFEQYGYCDACGKCAVGPCAYKE